MAPSEEINWICALALNNGCQKIIVFVFVNRNKTLPCITVCCALLFLKEVLVEMVALVDFIQIFDVSCTVVLRFN